ncbi:facilitated trehalose transporter Tret1-like [Pararge aegeria]|uniref:Jg23631 protein n=1 Tax=Pararge aegeria aegeria TaxID=348720 RepID=A0A8S4SI20_9NEOP|nr:facilitated trehalose transporter Tret1-like [Pararge aegeria]CAH2266507.1 jg23631 [Pararge aegeria aegeria]
MFLRITGIKLQVAISICLYLGPIISGYGGSWSGPVIPKLRDLEQSPFQYLLTETQLALVGSFAYLGAIPGPYITTWLSNSKGRKPCLIAGAVVSVLGYLFLALSTNLAMLYIGRFLTSVSFGTNSIVNFVYIGEIASPKIRGVLLSIIGAMFTVGSILVFSTGPYVSYYGTSYIGLALCLLHVICLLWIPESPIFYAIQGNEKELTKVLEDLGRSQDAERLLNMGKEITNTNTKTEWKELFYVKSNRKALFIAVIINVLQHGSGVMAVIFFSAAIFDMAGSSLKSHLAMILIGCCQLLGSTITPFFIESTGRKRILITSSAICSLSMFILGLYFYLDLIGNPVVDNIKWLPLVVLILFYIGYDFGLGIIPNAIMGEMFTPSVRSKGSTVTMTSSWLFGFLISTAFGALLEVVGGHVAFWFFSFTCACAAIFTVFFVPETKGKTLLEIQEGL